MATKVLNCYIFIINKSIFTTRSYTSLSLSTALSSSNRVPLHGCEPGAIRPLVALAATHGHTLPTEATLRGFATRQTMSSLNNSSPNWWNRVRLDGCEQGTIRPLVALAATFGYRMPTAATLGGFATRQTTSSLHLRLDGCERGMIRPLVAYAATLGHRSPTAATFRGFVTRQGTLSLNNWHPEGSNCPQLDDCDLKHWLVVMQKPEGNPTMEEIIYSYIKTLSQVIGSEDDARMKIYSVYTMDPFGFGALVSEELAYKIQQLPRVRSVLLDPSVDVRNEEHVVVPGCDFEHWVVTMKKPEGDPTRDEIIDRYIKTLAQVVGSEDEARMRIYSVSTKHYFAFGALLSEELSDKIEELPEVTYVFPDSYKDIRNKQYGGEPFINGQAVPYDPKYHEWWHKIGERFSELAMNAKPRSFDPAKDLERRETKMVGLVDGGMSPPQGNMGGGPRPKMGGEPQGNMDGAPDAA